MQVEIAFDRIPQFVLRIAATSFPTPRSLASR